MDSGVLFHKFYVTEKTILNAIKRECSLSFTSILCALILPERSFVRGIVKKRALNQNKNIIVYGKKSFLSTESETKILEYIFRLQSRHHQLLFK